MGFCLVVAAGLGGVVLWWNISLGAPAWSILALSGSVLAALPGSVVALLFLGHGAVLGLRRILTPRGKRRRLAARLRPLLEVLLEQAEHGATFPASGGAGEVAVLLSPGYGVQGVSDLSTACDMIAERALLAEAAYRLMGDLDLALYSWQLPIEIRVRRPGHPAGRHGALASEARLRRALLQAGVPQGRIESYSRWFSRRRRAHVPRRQTVASFAPTP